MGHEQRSWRGTTYCNKMGGGRAGVLLDVFTLSWNLSRSACPWVCSEHAQEFSNKATWEDVSPYWQLGASRRLDHSSISQIWGCCFWSHPLKIPDLSGAYARRLCKEPGICGLTRNHDRRGKWMSPVPSWLIYADIPSSSVREFWFLLEIFPSLSCAILEVHDDESFLPVFLC